MQTVSLKQVALCFAQEGKEGIGVGRVKVKAHRSLVLNPATRLFRESIIDMERADNKRHPDEEKGYSRRQKRFGMWFHETWLQQPSRRVLKMNINHCSIFTRRRHAYSE